MGRKSTFSDAQIVAAVREVEGGAKVGEVARKVGDDEIRRRAREGGGSLLERLCRRDVSAALLEHLALGL